ncbi:MAG: ribose-phosphate pyrophosphokinase [Bacteroidales bacterium]|jgi:ribose-phosphate pyrophosphokinase|nr:ribose-phosphate pyrophosphokinase [Bacteroidales bacterium]MBO7529229.1 ribose-phosphate pyrophosphokinase [Bacteroidales bacterium]
MQEPIVSIFSGRATKYLADQIAQYYGKPLGTCNVTVFSDGEFQPSFEENLRGRDVFLIQSTFPPTENLMELLMMVDAAKRASARRIIAVIPYFGFARQDRKDRPRISIAAKLVANLLQTAGVTRVITMDIHADQIQGFFDIPVDNLYASKIFVPYIQSLNLHDPIMASPDAGGTRRASSYAKMLGTVFCICHKQRSKPNEIEKMLLIGDVQDRDVILIDDIIDTAGTITRAGQLLKDHGARSVRAFATHPIFSGSAMEKIDNSVFDEVVVTDTIPLKNPSKKIHVLSTAELFAEVIKKVENYESLSEFFNAK